MQRGGDTVADEGSHRAKTEGVTGEEVAVIAVVLVVFKQLCKGTIDLW
ncbi:MAG: hypothetical protein KF860_16365 [Cyclobacteriaceae bacterium]|nr:hypothetical protein [Cyclobacteriaceae bacterium]